VALTADAVSEQREEASAPAAAYLVKPFTLAQLVVAFETS
jgi:CheY-like chemotaxis protein